MIVTVSPAIFFETESSCCQSELPRQIPQKNVESDHGCTSRNYFDTAGDNLTLALYNVMLTSQKPCLHNNKCDCSKTKGLNEAIKYCYSDILLKRHKLHSFRLINSSFRIIRIIDFNRAEPTCYRTNFPYAHTGQCKRTGGCYNELVVAFYSTGGGVKGKKIYTC